MRKWSRVLIGAMMSWSFFGLGQGLGGIFGGGAMAGLIGTASAGGNARRQDLPTVFETHHWL
jgi:hypothetical protein